VRARAMARQLRTVEALPAEQAPGLLGREADTADEPAA
jgi:hypothetical protein